MPTLWLCTWSPGAMSTVARPIDCPYLCTGAPAATGRTASLWLRGTSPASTTSPVAVRTRVPAASSRVVTATSSSGRSSSATSSRPRTSPVVAVMIGSFVGCGRAGWSVT